MITRRDFTKLASFAAGSTLVSSGGEPQEKRPPASGNPKAVTSGFVPGAGAEIYYECTGSGPAVVFAHGLGGNHLSWWQQVPYFSHQYSCVTFAHRGFSPSRMTSGTVDPALFEEDLLALVDHLELAEVRLVAQSMGGWTCLNFTLHHPQRVRALVMASTSGAVDLNTLDAADRKSLDSWLAVHGGIEAELRKQGIHPAAGDRMAREQPALEFLYREIDRLSAGLDKEALRAKLMAMRTVSAADLKHLRVPTLFISGAEDILFPPPAAAALASLVPGAKLESVPEAGHSVYFQRAEIFNRLASNFFEKHQASSAGSLS
ncbi:MAG TPA: alpha/beta hydrolase [Candidatus Acidoferrum sp.]|nr:alpha/beta hydrolase [Candidatus Acidoferrum sp.]